MAEPYNCDGVRYSGLETSGMKRLNKSMLLPEDPQIDVGKLWLEPSRVTVKFDYGSPHTSIDFPGAGVCMFKAAGANTGSMPTMMCVAGKCRYTKACFKEFQIMFRTKEQGKAQGLGKNSELKWPDVRAFECCPVCAKAAEKTRTGKEYWMVFHLLMTKGSSSAVPQMIIGSRLQCQLVCVDCFGGLIQDQNFADSPQKVSEVFQAMPGMPLFVGSDRNCYNMEGSEIHTAWKLYMTWEYKGAFQALSNTLLELIQSSSGLGEPEKLADANAKRCLVCKKTLKAAKVCSRCKTATYCGASCQKKDWKRHKVIDCVKKEVKVGIHAKASFQASAPVCSECGAKDIDQVDMVMCFYCGRIEQCMACGNRKGFLPYQAAPLCGTCGCQDHELEPMLQHVVETKGPVSPQGKYARLMLAQLKMYPDEDGIAGNPSDAKKELESLARLGYPLAQYLVGSLYQRDIEENAYFGPIQFLGFPNEKDIPFPINHEKAKEFFQETVKCGHPFYLNEIGVLYKNGTLFDQDYHLAFSLFQKAADQGDPRAMCNAGQMLARGLGMPQDMRRAVEYYRRAASDHDWESAKFMLFQFSQRLADLVPMEEGMRYLRELQESGFLEDSHAFFAARVG